MKLAAIEQWRLLVEMAYGARKIAPPSDRFFCRARTSGVGGGIAAYMAASSASICHRHRGKSFSA